jgi:hypothetical protein
LIDLNKFWDKIDQCYLNPQGGYLKSNNKIGLNVNYYLVKVSLGLRLGQAVRRRRIRQERKPRNSRDRRMANVAIGQKTNSCFVGTTKRILDD